VALGLARDDAMIKRRVRQKLDVLFEESAAQHPEQARTALAHPRRRGHER
jgi:hypothetical protein